MKSFHPSWFVHRLCAKSLNLIRLVLSWPRTSRHITTHLVLTSFYLDFIPCVAPQHTSFYLVLSWPHTSHHIATHLALSRPCTSCLAATHLVLPCSILTLYLTSHLYSPRSISNLYFNLATITHRFYLTQCRTSTLQHRICLHSSRKHSDKSSQLSNSFITHTLQRKG
jgi:hypothetical protein